MTGSRSTVPSPLRQAAESAATPVTFTVPAGDIAALEVRPESSRGIALLVPGYTGSKEDFVAVLGPLADAGFHAVAIDLRGQFQSPGPDDPSAYTVDELAHDLVAIGTQLGHDSVPAGLPVHLLGHSFGGLVSRGAVLSAPRVFTTLTLLASGPSGLVGPRAELLKFTTPKLARLGLIGLYDLTQAMARREAGHVEPPAPLAEFLRTRFAATEPASLIGMGAAMLGEPDRVAELRATKVPVLVAYSDRDNAWSPAAQKDMAERLGATRVVVADSEHSPALENPAVTVGALVEFWREHTGQGRPLDP